MMGNITEKQPIISSEVVDKLIWAIPLTILVSFSAYKWIKKSSPKKKGKKKK